MARFDREDCKRCCRRATLAAGKPDARLKIELPTVADNFKTDSINPTG
jgi:hypothetical protein